MKPILKKILLLAIVLGLFGAGHMLGVTKYLALSSLQENASMLKSTVEEQYALSTISYLAVYIVIVALSLPGATILTLGGGFLFGAFVGTLLVNIAATTGATLAFLVSRYIAGDWVQKKYAAQLEKFNRELDQNGSNYMLTLRFIPLFPFFLINLCAGLTKIPLRTFVWTTSVGILPGSFVYAYAGQQLATITSLGDIVSFEIISAFVLLGLLSLTPTIIKKYKQLIKSNTQR